MHSLQYLQMGFFLFTCNFFFSSSLLCWRHLYCRSAAMTASPCHQYAQVPMSSWGLCWNSPWGLDGELTVQEMSWFLLQFLFLLLHNLRLYSPIPLFRVSLEAGLPKLGQSNTSSGEDLSGSCLWDPVTCLHRAEQLSLARVELQTPQVQPPASPPRQREQVASQAVLDKKHSLTSEP